MDPFVVVVVVVVETVLNEIEKKLVEKGILIRVMKKMG